MPEYQIISGQEKSPKKKKSFWGHLLDFFRGEHQQVWEDDVLDLLEEGKLSGSIDASEHELIESIFKFTDTTVKEIMIPRSDIIAIDINIPREKLHRVVIDEGFSRIPVFSGTLDNIIGILYTKDLLSMFEHRDIILLHDIIRLPFLVPESKKISKLLRELQVKKQHIAIVIGEFGGTEGIVTMEDIIEEIVGEIRDEYDEDRKEVEQSNDGSVTVSAAMSIPDFNEKFKVNIPEGTDYETISGLVNKTLGRIPELHEEIQVGKIAFSVTKRNQRRIQMLKVRLLP